MDKNLLKQQLKTDLDLINEQAGTILGYTERIPQIELDLLRNNVIEFYEKLLILGKQNSHTLIREEIKTPAPEKVFETVVTIEKTVQPPVEEPVSVSGKISPEPENTVQPVVSLPETESPAEEIPLLKKEEPPVKENQKKQKSTLDLFSESSQTTVGEKLSQKQASLNETISKGTAESSVNAKLQKQPIRDLKNAIGINEKFLFINELFDGNMHEYNETLTRIQTTCESFPEAEQVLAELKNRYQWNENKSSVSLFRNLVERRFL